MRTRLPAILLLPMLLIGCQRSHLQEARACYQYATTSTDNLEATFFHTIAAEEFVMALRHENLNTTEEIESRSKLIRSLMEIGLESMADTEIQITARTFEDHTYRSTPSEPGVLHLVSAERARLLAALATEELARMELLEEAVTEAYLAHNRFQSEEARRHVDLIKVRLLRLRASAMLAFLEPDNLNYTQKAQNTLDRALKICMKHRGSDFRKEKRRIQGAIFALKTYP